MKSRKSIITGWWTRSIFGLLLVTFAFHAAADMFTPSPYCSKPYKPIQFSSQYQLDNFMDEVESYKSCIMNFVEEQQESAKKHQEAAEQAIDTWNSFVNYELN